MLYKDLPPRNVEPEILALQRSIQREKLERAKKLTFEERMRLGADLFDDQMKWIRGFIAGEHPEWTAEEVEKEIDRRLRIGQLNDDAGLYKPCGTISING